MIMLMLVLMLKVVLRDGQLVMIMLMLALILKLLLRDGLRLFCMHAPLITYVGDTPFPKVCL